MLAASENCCLRQTWLLVGFWQVVTWWRTMNGFLHMHIHTVQSFHTWTILNCQTGKSGTNYWLHWVSVWRVILFCIQSSGHSQTFSCFKQWLSHKFMNYTLLYLIFMCPTLIVALFTCHIINLCYPYNPQLLTVLYSTALWQPYHKPHHSGLKAHILSTLW